MRAERPTPGDGLIFGQGLLHLGGRGNLKALLKLDFQVDLPERIQLCTCPLRLIDVAVPGLVLATLLGLWVNAA